jgi:hypothetical protein
MKSSARDGPTALEANMAHQTVGKGAMWGGRIATLLPVAMLLMSGTFKVLGAVTGGKEMLENWAKSGYPAGTLLPIGLVEMACAVLYLVPRTSVLGAVLVTGYLGGAVATHVRAAEIAFLAPLLLGVLAWGGLWLRDPRLRALLPLRRGP